MLWKRWPLLRRCVDILLGRRRSYRPGALTARIFVEFDRAHARAKLMSAAKLAAVIKNSPLTDKKPIEIKAERLRLRNDRMVVKPVRKPLASTRMVNRPAVGKVAAPEKRRSQRVVWLGVAPKPISTAIRVVTHPVATATDAKPRLSNVVALHRLEPVSRPGARIAA